MLKFNCPHCKRALRAPEEKVGVVVSCPGCRGSVRIPSAEEVIRYNREVVCYNRAKKKELIYGILAITFIIVAVLYTGALERLWKNISSSIEPQNDPAKILGIISNKLQNKETPTKYEQGYLFSFYSMMQSFPKWDEKGYPSEEQILKPMALLMDDKDGILGDKDFIKGRNQAVRDILRKVKKDGSGVFLIEWMKEVEKNKKK